jgi:3-hydroxybutyryl-CoA dehydrogenase
MALTPEPDSKEILAIFGPGNLGIALAGFAAERGLEVLLAGRDGAHGSEGVSRIHARWERDVAQGKRSAQAVVAARSRLRKATSVEMALEQATVIMEAVPEDLESKQRLWSKLSRSPTVPALLLTGSSSLPLAEIRRGASLDAWLLGFHLFLPLDRMDALELVTEAGTPPDLVARAEALGEALGRHTFRVLDGAGYAASRMALAQGLEAMRLLERGLATAAALDGLMTRGYGHPVGPLELSDRIGLDLRLSIAQGLHQATGNPAFQPPPILEGLVRRGCTGRSAGVGFYRWNPEGTRQ